MNNRPFFPNAFGLRQGLAILLASLCICATSEAATGRYSKAELGILPAYCADSELASDYERMGPKWHYWVARMGDLFNSVHHYCEGMMNVIQARIQIPKSQAQTILLRKAINEFDFMLNSSPQRLKNFVLLPELLVKRGEVGVMLEDWTLAYSSYEQARQVKPDYWPAYTGWAEVLAKLNLKKEALALLKQGLLINPTAEPMRQLYAKLGGALKDIPNEPPKPAAAEPAASTASEPQAPTPDGASAAAR